MRFKDFFKIINEAKFRNSKYLQHIMDVPMFSVFINNEDTKTEDAFVLDKSGPTTLAADVKTNHAIVRDVLSASRKEIGKMGFASMHANIVIKDLSNERNQITGGGIGGWAHRSRKYMTVDTGVMLDYFQGAVNTVVHEWAHLYLFNNSKAFKNAVKSLYKDVILGGAEKAVDTKKDLYGDFASNLGLMSNMPSKKKGYRKMNSFYFGSLFGDSDVVEKRVASHLNSAIRDYFRDYLLGKMERIPLDNFQYLPHGLIVPATLYDDLPLADSYHNYKTFPKGSKVTLFKTNTGWLIDAYDGNKRYSKSVDDRIPYEIEEQGGQFQDLVKKSLLRVRDMYKSHDRYKDENIKKEVENIFKSFNVEEFGGTQLRDALMKLTEKYIVPQFFDLVKTEAGIRKLLDDPYQALWTENEYNIDAESYQDIAAKHHFKKQIKNKEKIDTPKDNALREYVAFLNDWPNSYGMANLDEYWATAIEKFFQLPLPQRKYIINAMQNKY